MFGIYRVYLVFNYFHMQVRCKKTAQMHLNTSPTCFEEPRKIDLKARGRKIEIR